MRTLLLSVLVAAAAAPTLAAAQDVSRASQPAAGADRDVVVTGHRLRDTEAALKACLARGCPPDQDIAATLAHAENQFVGGDYKNARATLLASIGRNKRHAHDYPVPVSDLLRAQARVASHLGEHDSYRVGQIDSLDALKAGLPADDPRVLAQRLEVADAFAVQGRADGALLMYRDLVGDARRLGNRRIEGYALLRRAVLLGTLADIDRGTYAADAKVAIAALTESTDPQLAPFKAAAELLAARRAAKAGDTAAIDRLVATYARPGKRPVLLYSPTYIEQDSDRLHASNGSATTRLAVGDFDGQWADVGFWIKPDGSVGDVDILRGSPTLDRSWVKPLEKVIAGRRYTPLALPRDDPGLLRVERYTRTAWWTEATGTHLRVRQPVPRIEMLDLTNEAATASAPSAPPGVPAAAVAPGPG